MLQLERQASLHHDIQANGLISSGLQPYNMSYRRGEAIRAALSLKFGWYRRRYRSAFCGSCDSDTSLLLFLAWWTAINCIGVSCVLIQMAGGKTVFLLPSACLFSPRSTAGDSRLRHPSNSERQEAIPSDVSPLYGGPFQPPSMVHRWSRASVLTAAEEGYARSALCIAFGPQHRTTSSWHLAREQNKYSKPLVRHYMFVSCRNCLPWDCRSKQDGPQATNSSGRNS